MGSVITKKRNGNISRINPTWFHEILAIKSLTWFGKSIIPEFVAIAYIMIISHNHLPLMGLLLKLYPKFATSLESLRLW